MKSFAPIPALVGFSFVFFPPLGVSHAVSFEVSLALATAGHFAASDDSPDFVPDDMSIPGEMLDIMRVSHLRYQEGSSLLKSGQSARARAAFNSAVDSILKSEWDLASEPVLNHFFEELIRRIQQDEARYLRPEQEPEDAPETAVVDELEKLDLIPITVEPSLRDVVESDLANTRYDIPITLNEAVLKSLNYWLTRGKKYFSDGLVRSGQYREMIERIFREASLPLDVMYLAQVESLFKPHALSRRAAKGIWQFTRATAVRYGLRVDRHVDERSDPEKSTRAAARYLNDLYAMFRDWNLVMAAYNWGEGRVQKLVNRSGLNDFWDLMDLRRNFPKETRNHVPLIMASIILARNPEKYGMPTELAPPIAYERVPIARPIDLRVAAKTLDVPVSRLKELNPELRGHITPLAYPDYELKVPEGMGRVLEDRLASLPAAKPEPFRSASGGRHRVRPGDTLHRIALQHRVSVTALQKANGIRSPKLLRVGMWLNIPAPQRGAGQASTARTERGTALRAQQAAR